MTPKVLGILNVTPDSFSDGGLFRSVDDARMRVMEMVRQGADAIDIGGESTRPGSFEISVEEELERVIPVLEAISCEIEVPLSIDTRRAEVVREALSHGVSIVNDTSALQDDSELCHVIAQHQLTVILMHRKGTPESMQRGPGYIDVLAEIHSFLEERIEFALGSGSASALQTTTRLPGASSFSVPFRFHCCWEPRGSRSREYLTIRHQSSACPLRWHL